MPVLNCLDYCGFVVDLEVGKRDPPALLFFLRIASALQGLLWFHMNFKTICFGFLKNVVGILIGIALNL